jgi:short chain dehydrogenase
VVASSRTIKRLQEPNLVTVAGDITEPATAGRIVDTALDRFGRIDTLVNNAGVVMSKPSRHRRDGGAVRRPRGQRQRLTRASTSVSTGATGPPGLGLWKRAQTPIKERAMATIHRHQTTTAAPEQFLAGLTDFGPGRSKIFPNSADGYLKVRDQGSSQADVTEGSNGVWERLHYDWSDPGRITMKSTGSNLWGGRSGHTYTLTSRPGGTTDIDDVVVREGKNLNGRLFEILLATGGKRVLGKALAATVKAIEARNYQPGQVQS